MTVRSQIPVIEFRSLLHEIRDLRPDIGLRLRLMGEMWQPFHYHVFQITDRGVALCEELSRKLIIIPDLGHVMQFEIDQSFKQFEPHFHYAVDPTYVNA